MFDHEKLDVYQCAIFFREEFIGANRSYAHQNVPSFGVRSSTSTFTYYVHDNTHERLRKGMLQTLYNLLLIRS
jgi:hypothetical protein